MLQAACGITPGGVRHSNEGASRIRPKGSEHGSFQNIGGSIFGSLHQGSYYDGIHVGAPGFWKLQNNFERD